MEKKTAYTFINHQTGNLAFKLISFENNSHFDHLQRNNFYSLIWVREGKGLLKVDFSEYLFESNTLFAFAPYQPFMISTDQNIHGIAIQFHSDFYCIHRNPKETNCDTTLFNNIYEPPCLSIDQASKAKLTLWIDQLKLELNDGQNFDYELLIPHLKIILVNLSRIKQSKQPKTQMLIENQTPYLLEQLKSSLENHYKEKHSASEYATLLRISPSALARLVKKHLNKTPTELITERILLEAKRELYMTTKTIKEVAWDLGYKDEYYFSRVFKSNTGVSPQKYRNTVGFGKAEIES